MNKELFRKTEDKIVRYYNKENILAAKQKKNSDVRRSDKSNRKRFERMQYHYRRRKFFAIIWTESANII